MSDVRLMLLPLPADGYIRPGCRAMSAHGRRYSGKHDSTHGRDMFTMDALYMDTCLDMCRMGKTITILFCVGVTEIYHRNLP